MEYICNHCDTELELDNVESEQPYAGSNQFIEYYTYVCPKCGRRYQNSALYTFTRETELFELK